MKIEETDGLSVADQVPSENHERNMRQPMEDELRIAPPVQRIGQCSPWVHQLLDRALGICHDSALGKFRQVQGDHLVLPAPKLVLQLTE